MGLFSKILGGLGLKQEVEVESSPAPSQQKVEQQQNNEKQYSIGSLVCYAPKSNTEVKMLIDYIKKGEPCIINLAELGGEDIKSVLDYLGGAMYALGGMLSRLQGDIYVLSPKDVKLNTNFSA